MSDEVRIAVLVASFGWAAVGVYGSFRKSLRRENGRHYELGSGRIFDAFTTDWGFPLFLACALVSIIDAALSTSRLSPHLQDAGVLWFVLSCGLLLWADARLARHFSSYSEANPQLMTEGPYRLVRHPRYASWIGLLVSFAIALGSLWGILASVPFLAIVIRRVRLEDRFLNELYGDRYQVYAAGTYRLLPGIW